MSYRLELLNNNYVEGANIPTVLVTFRGYIHSPQNDQGPNEIAQLLERRCEQVPGKKIVLLEFAHTSTKQGKEYEKRFRRTGLIEGLTEFDPLMYTLDRFRTRDDLTFVVESHEPNVRKDIIHYGQKGLDLGSKSSDLLKKGDLKGSFETFIESCLASNKATLIRTPDLLKQSKRLIWKLKETGGGLLFIPFGYAHFPFFIRLAEEFKNRHFVGFETILSAKDHTREQIELTLRRSLKPSRLQWVRYWALVHFMNKLHSDLITQEQDEVYRQRFENSEQQVSDALNLLTEEEINSIIRRTDTPLRGSITIT